MGIARQHPTQHTNQKPPTLMIKTLTLVNFRKHRDLHIDFAQGLTVLAGDNEAGKSSVLEALLYAWGGSRALPRSLDATVTYGQPVSSLKVQLTFEVGGVLYTLTRSKAGAELAGGGSLSVGQTEVTAAVERLLGASAATLSRLLVARQTDLKGVAAEGAAAVKLIEELAELGAIEDLVEKVQAQLPYGSTKAALEKIEVLRQEHAPELPDFSPELKQAELEASLAAAEASEGAELEREALAELLDAQAADRAHQAAKSEQARLQAILAQPQTKPLDHAATPVEQIIAARTEQARQVELRNAWAAWNSLAVVPDPGPMPAVDHGTPEKLQTQLRNLGYSRPQIESHCEHCGSPLEPPTAEILARVAGIDAEMAKLRAEHQAAVAARVEAVAAQTAWCSAQENWKAYLHKLSLLSRYVQDETWVGGPVSSEVDTTNYDVMLNRELAKQREAAQIEERIKLESVQRAQAEKELARLVVPPAVTDLDSLSKHAALRSSQARVLDRLSSRAAAELQEKREAFQGLKAAFDVMVATYQAGQAQLAELTRTISEMDANNALIKKLRQARPVLAAKLWAGLLAAISRTFSELRGTPSVVGRSADGFEVDGKPAADLSGSTLDILGLAVRISLMRAFLPGVGLLILDEPAAAMDAAREERLLAALATLDFGQVLMVSHGDTAKAVAGNVVLL